jgi:hypothetical protein
MYVHYFTAIVEVKSTVNIEVITKETNSLYVTNIKTQFSHIIHTRGNCSFLTPAANGSLDGRDV